MPEFVQTPWRLLWQHGCRAIWSFRVYRSEVWFTLAAFHVYVRSIEGPMFDWRCPSMVVIETAVGTHSLIGTAGCPAGYNPYRLRFLVAQLQTSIITDGFRSLRDGEPVEFYVEQASLSRQTGSLLLS